jgi:signal transduction histidine kinase
VFGLDGVKHVNRLAMSNGLTFSRHFEHLKTLVRQHIGSEVVGTPGAPAADAEPVFAAGLEPLQQFEEKRLAIDNIRPALSGPDKSLPAKRVQRAVLDERTRLARELHDGVLQSLTGAALQIHTLCRLIDKSPGDARDRLHCLENLLAEEQHALRSWIDTLKPSASQTWDPGRNLAVALERLCHRVERQWGVSTELDTRDTERIPGPLGNEVYRLVQEGLNNIGRHACARTARVELEAPHRHVHLFISDDGCGFPFVGRYELAALASRNLGPVSFRERVASLGGELVLDSSDEGSHLDTFLPLCQPSSRSTLAGRGTIQPRGG